MARAAVKAKQAQRAKTAPKPHGRRRHASGGNPNQQLFFMRMRRHAKWVYVLLAVLFALTFAFLGVGSGTNGGLSDLFKNVNIFGGGGGPSVSSAQKAIRDHPNDPKGYRDLATAYESKGDTTDAISALQELTLKKPKDAQAWTELAGLQQTQAQNYLTDYQNAYEIQQLAAPSAAFLPTGKLATAIGTNPIEQAASTTASSATNDLYQKVQLAYNGSVQSWTALSKLQPKSADVWFSLGQAAQSAGDSATAVKAYTTYLKLNPDATSAAQIRALIKSLKGSSHP
jgi:Flp pilus assembly protein TadD